MNNLLTIDGQKAVIVYDPDIEMFRGEFVGLNGGADFYATSLEGLMQEGRASLEVYLDMCRQKNIAPQKTFSGRFNLRLDPQLHKAASTAAAAHQQSLNEWVADAIKTAADQA